MAVGFPRFGPPDPPHKLTQVTEISTRCWDGQIHYTIKVQTALLILGGVLLNVFCFLFKESSRTNFKENS